MKNTEKVVKEHHLYKMLVATFEEAGEFISYLSPSNEWMTEEMKYFHDFISYKKIEDGYSHFWENAHLKENPDILFSSYVF